MRVYRSNVLKITNRMDAYALTSREHVLYYDGIPSLGADCIVLSNVLLKAYPI